MTEEHQVIFVDGCATESFWPGPEALRSLDDADRREVFDLFPELLPALAKRGSSGREIVSQGYGPLARRDLRRKDITRIEPYQALRSRHA